jgi:hypothetical protein
VNVAALISSCSPGARGVEWTRDSIRSAFGFSTPLGTEEPPSTRESRNTQSLELRFRATLDEGTAEVQLALS